jgi:tyrosine-protein kinase Etk/Wzc
MVDGPKFRRKRTSATGNRLAASSVAPIPQVDEIAQEAARQKAEAEQHARAQEAARQKVELVEKAQAEAMRRLAAARKQRDADAARAAAEADAREASLIAERERAKAEAEAEAKAKAEKAAELAAHQAAQEKARKAQEAARKADAARQRAKAEKEAAERRHREKAEETARLAEQERIAQERLADERRAEARLHEQRLAKEKREAEQRARDLRLAEARAADALRIATDQRIAEKRMAEQRRAAAAAEAPPLSLTDMVPVTKPAPAPPNLGTDPGTDAADRPAARPVQLHPAKPPKRPDDKAAANAAWQALPELSLDEDHLSRNRIITASREDPAHSAFDVLRTRLLQALSENGWRRVAITSPGKDCGKTFTAANLAISMSRQENCRTMLMDFDMRRPSLHRVLGIDSPGSVGDMLRGVTAPEDHMRRMGSNTIHAGRNIAFACNDQAEPYASELLQDPRTATNIDAIEAQFAPDVMLFDLPPALFYDDVIAFRPMFDGVLLVIGGGQTTEREVKEVERRLGPNTPLLGMVLNRAEGSDLKRYGY